MNIRILQIKPKVIIDGKEYVDLSVNSFKTDMVFTQILGYDIVTPETEMRIDKIALKWYGTTENIDILLKANNIFNPFSIKTDDVLIIPNIRSSEDIHKSNSTVTKTDLRDLFLKTQALRKTNITQLTKTNEDNKSKKNKLKTPLPPNMLQKGDKNRKQEGSFINLTNNK